MALLCNKIGRITDYFENALKNKLKKITTCSGNKLVDIMEIIHPFSKDLNIHDYLHMYDNASRCPQIFENSDLYPILDKINHLSEAKENFGNDSIFLGLQGILT
jgi:hypothetical protein